MERNTLFFLLFAVFTLVSCEDYEPKSHHISVIIDRSEMDSYAPNSSNILTYLSDAHPTDAINISLSYISDTQYTSRYNFVLDKAQTGWLSNEDKRRKARRKFLKRFEDSLSYFNSQQKPLRRSAIFNVVMQEVGKASKSNRSSQILLFSDLREHSFLGSVYEGSFRRKLLYNTDAVANSFMQQTQLPQNLSGITLRIIYKPSLEEAPVFTAMVAIYKNIIESRGGTVVIGRHTKIKSL